MGHDIALARIWSATVLLSPYDSFTSVIGTGEYVRSAAIEAR